MEIIKEVIYSKKSDSNCMDPSSLPIVGPLQNVNQDIIDDFSSTHIGIKNKNVLVIGYSSSEIDTYVSKYSPKSIKILTLWESHVDAHDQKYPLFIGDISHSTPFKENEFDAVLTLSLFEHVPDIRGALAEVRRVLSPQGYLFIHYGPVWSSAVGHHLYSLPGDNYLDFTRGFMPAHIHLLCNQSEIEGYYLQKGYSHEQITTALFWFYETDIINRLPFEEYMREFTDFFTIVKTSLMYHDLPLSHIQLLRSKYPHLLDFSTYGGNFLLKNRKR